MKSGIYTITCIPNNKMYVGYASDLERRKIDHYAVLRNNKHCNTYLQNAYNKYGGDNIIFEELVECPEHLLVSEEHYWATILKTHNKKYGFNIKPTHPEKINLRNRETTIKIYKTRKERSERLGYWCTPETTEKRLKTRRENAEKRGYWHSEKTKLKIGIKSIGRNKIPDSLRTKKRRDPLLERYKHSEEARLKKRGKSYLTEQGKQRIIQANTGRKWGPEFRLKISNSLKGKKKSPESVEKLRERMTGKKMTDFNRQQLNKALRKPIIQLDKEGNIIRDFNSIREAGIFLGKNTNNVSVIGAVCSGKRKTAFGYKWRYK